VGAEGAIFIWKMPEEIIQAKADNELPTISKADKNEKP
jgi:cilia- and flagella-associated protein 52